MFLVTRKFNDSSGAVTTVKICDSFHEAKIMVRDAILNYLLESDEDYVMSPGVEWPWEEVDKSGFYFDEENTEWYGEGMYLIMTLVPDSED